MNARDPVVVAQEAEFLATFLDNDADRRQNEVTKNNLRRAAAFIREAYPDPTDQVAPEPGPLTITVELLGSEHEMQILGACVHLLNRNLGPGAEALNNAQRARICGYLADRFGR